ncbi:MAG: sensor histidine kinase [Eubacteriales bacterium]
MVELSLNILDIAQNGIKAGASLVEISVLQAGNVMNIAVRDNGCGMTAEQVAQVTDPFYTTRTTRPVGLGVPFFKMSAEMTGGSFSIESMVGEGTITTAVYQTESIDMMPLGDMAATMVSLIAVNPDLDFTYTYGIGEHSFTLDTRDIKVTMEGIPIESPEILAFIGDYIRENTCEIKMKG